MTTADSTADPAAPANVPTGARALPVAERSRWMPLRIGLVDLFHYDEQQFWFRDGRLLLRGNNGAGKSKVLALTLPFLLDGDLSAHRVEPDGDPKKRMEWNLLLDGVHEERLGYTWIELGRVTEGGDHAYVTLGCGLKAARGRGIADKWFFVTSRRVGQDLFLMSEQGTALTRDRLEAALGGDGTVLRGAEQYRRHVDEHLFGLGPERYDAMVDLLVQLRQPALSKRPDEGRLSAALSEALAPVDQAVLADVAAALHDLEQQRDELAALRETSAGVERFLGRYAAYARVAARRAGSVLRRSQSAYDDAGRRLLTARTELTERIEQQARSETVLAGLEDQQVALTATKEELAARPEIKDLEQVVRFEEAMRREFDAAQARQRDADTQRTVRARKHTEALDAAASADSALRDAAAAAAVEAAAAGLGADHDAVVPRLLVPSSDSGSADRAGRGAEVERALGAAADRRADGCRHVRGLVDRAAETARELAAARRRVEDRASELQTAQDRSEQAAVALDDQSAAFVGAWAGYLDGLVELVVGHPEEHGLPLWTTTLDGVNPSATALAGVAAQARAGLAEAVATARSAQAAVGDERQGWVRERDGLLAGTPPVPVPARTRDAAVRAGTPGAPLWQVVDFGADVPDADRAGYEAALEAAGLLDAWVAPDGRLLDAAGDAVVVPGGPAPAVPLSTVLRPSLPSEAVDQSGPLPSSEVVAAVLATIGAVPGGSSEAIAAEGEPADSPHTWVAPDGSFRVGALRGRWHKPAAEFVGHAAREAARQRRLDELTRAISAADDRLGALAAELAGLAQRQARVEAEAAQAPSDDALRSAHLGVARARADVETARTRVAAEEATALLAGEQHDAALRDLVETAADLGLPADAPGLIAVEAAVTGYRGCVVRLVQAWVRAGEAADAVRLWAQELAVAVERLEQAITEADLAAERHTDALARRSTLESSVGATVAELQGRLAAVQRELGTLVGALKAARDEQLRSQEQLGQARGRLAELEDRHTEHATARDEAAAAFQRFAGTGLLAIAVPGVETPDQETPWAADPTVRLARKVDAGLQDVDASDQIWKRLQEEITRHVATLADALSRNGHSAYSELREERLVVTVVFQGRDRDPASLLDLLAEEVEYRDRILSAKERDLLEEHLVTDVASHLQELISEAEAQVAQMNAELEERPTSTGMRLRLRWEVRPDGPDGLEQARARLLRQTSDLWSPEDRTAVSAFLARQIERERTANELGTWHEHLARALDYRGWHRFVIERYQDGRWRPATGPASGGERVLTVSLPLFAAASAHYRSARPEAPRLVLLDEAFAGVDDDSRAKCLGLLAAFDLDVVMTSEREWGFYATVPGIATHQLVRRDGIDAVHVSVWEWDGAQARLVDRDASARVPPRTVVVDPSSGAGSGGAGSTGPGSAGAGSAGGSSSEPTEGLF